MLRYGTVTMTNPIFETALCRGATGTCTEIFNCACYNIDQQRGLNYLPLQIKYVHTL